MINILQEDIQRSVGTLQTCSGVESGIEAAVHSMKITFNQEGSEGMLLVDATNAFNTLNRAVALHNIKEICPSFYCFLNNCYKSPSNLFISGSTDSPPILSQEGATQGDPAAMPMYALVQNPYRID